jgi:uncharacterized protein involved in exopolysaccharide biosynthesis
MIAAQRVRDFPAMSSARSRATTRVETDVPTLFRSLVKAAPYLLLFAALSAAVCYLIADRLTPLYRAEARIFIAVTDPNPEVLRQGLSAETQLIRSPDLAREVIDDLGLAATPEYREAVEDGSLLQDILAAFGLARDAGDASPEARVLAHYEESLSVNPIEGSPVIAIAFQSANPELAARAANAIADGYLALRRLALGGATAEVQAEVDRLQEMLAGAEARADELRAEVARLPPSLSASERAALEAELSAAEDSARRAASDAAAIRAGLDKDTIPRIPALLDDPAVRRLLAEQDAVRRELAEQTAANPLGNPRVAELRARLAEIDAEIAAAAARIAGDLEAEAERGNARAGEIEQRLADSDAAERAAAELLALDPAIAEHRERLGVALSRLEALSQNGSRPAKVEILTRATVPAKPDWPDVGLITALAFLIALALAAADVVVREFVGGRALRRVPFEPLADLDRPEPAAGRLRRVDEEGVSRAMPDEPTIAPAIDAAEASLGAVADGIAGRRRVIVALAEDSDSDGRPLAAVALVRALSARDRSVVLVDLHDDGADTVAMGEAADLPGFADLLAGEAPFSQVIFRDRRSRAHFIPAGSAAVPPEALSGERLATLLAALDATYDHVVIDCPDETVTRMAAGADAALVASEYGRDDPRTERAMERIAKVSAARIFLLVVEPARRPTAEAA